MSDSPYEESKWVQDVSNSVSNEIGIVGYADLSKKDVDSLLKSQSELKGMRGIRQILNHHPTNPNLTWPKVERPNYLTSEDWKSGYALLEKYNFSFDLQINPHQLKVINSFFK